MKEIPAERLEASVVARIQSASSPIAVACSGGPDSVVAALVTCALAKVPVTILHFDHRLRGSASRKDAEFVRKLAKEIGADFRLGAWDKPDKGNELLAREARMAFLHQWEHEYIVFGHHADDAVETFLMRLARGGGITGLCAPHPINSVGPHTHLRPLITLRKKEIVKALKACGIPYRQDHTNSGTDYLRNRIRNKLLPLWQRIETRNVAEGILRTQRGLREMAAEAESPVLAVEKENGSFLKEWSMEGSLPMEGSLFLPFGGCLKAKRSKTDVAKIKSGSGPFHVWIKDPGPLFVRKWSAGERYTPFCSPGSRKVKELLNENCGEVEPNIRAYWPVVVDAAGKPLWIPGLRVAQQAQAEGWAFGKVAEK